MISGLMSLGERVEIIEFRLRLADDQLRDTLDLLAKCLIDEDEAAREWLCVLAQEYREGKT